MTKATEFTQVDWDAFSGCTSWTDGEPLARELEDGTLVIADSTCLAAHYVETEGSSKDSLTLDIVFPNQNCARTFLDAMPERVSPQWLVLHGFLPD